MLNKLKLFVNQNLINQFLIFISLVITQITWSYIVLHFLTFIKKIQNCMKHRQNKTKIIEILQMSNSTQKHVKIFLKYQRFWGIVIEKKC